MLLLAGLAIWGKFQWDSRSNLASLGPEAPTLQAGDISFRDLNNNGALDVYEDSRQPVEARVDDLLSQMKLEEKAGTMFINFTVAGRDGELVEGIDLSEPLTLAFTPNSGLIASKKMNHISLINVVKDASNFAEWHNKMQKLAERTRLGIPITFASDPRNAVGTGGGVALPSGSI